MSDNTELRPLYEVVREVAETWKATSKSGIYFGAKPYLKALSLPHITDENSQYGAETAGDMVPYLLGNMQTFRGADARRLKAELKQYSRWTRGK